MDPKVLKKIRDNSTRVAYHQFVLLTGKASPNALFCFFEGKDAPYYHIRIKTNYSHDYHYIKCGGKKRVLEVYELIKSHSEYDNLKKAFFIDRDFDESIKDKDKNIYETPCYSIENLYCSVACFSDFLKSELNLVVTSKEYKNILKFYNAALNRFLKATLLFNAWYKMQKQKSEENKIPNNVSLGDSLIPEFISVTLYETKKKYDLDTIRAKYSNCLPLTKKSINEKISELRKSDLVQSLRGKCIFNFVIVFIRLLIEDANTKGKKTLLKNKVKYNIDKTTALSLLSAYAETPPCLVNFIKSYN